MLTRRCHKAIAKAVYESSVKNEDALYKGALVTRLSQIFKQDNPSFNLDKFRAACYYGRYIE